ncbi:AAA family ATPase [Nocardiopsis composta]|uniref:MoxR-like ATPase n=1 Tax=Nocardiopsis composta TaxID=157465 RepID=A0A7W8VHA1_9ACTN|nr:MoxR family ATPase [Nocardiopsis composta]MBB5435819.1 MoxR-like ATPase [Nocardiopsis composta]
MTSDPGSGPGTPEGAAAPSWWVYRGTGAPSPYAPPLRERLPPPPPWRRFPGAPDTAPPPEDPAETERVLGPPRPAAHRPLSPAETEVATAVNAALLLRRPLLVTGPPGVGKSSLAYRVARELGLGRVLRWSITSRSTLASGLYEYDPLARIHDISADAAAAPAGGAPAARRPIGDYLRLGPLGTALLPTAQPRALVIDEFDKGDADLANDLLDVLESGGYRIPELARLSSSEPEVTVPTDDPGRTAVVRHGSVTCHEFPFTVITSNSERPFPAAFRRRCLPVELRPPDREQLAEIVAAHFGTREQGADRELIRAFLEESADKGGLSIDQLLNSVHLVSADVRDHATSWDSDAWQHVLDVIWQRLTETDRE